MDMLLKLDLDSIAPVTATTNSTEQQCIPFASPSKANGTHQAPGRVWRHLPMRNQRWIGGMGKPSYHSIVLQTVFSHDHDLKQPNIKGMKRSS